MRSGQFGGALAEQREVAQLGQGRDRPGDAACRAVPAGPGDLHVHLLAGPGHGDADLLDQVPDQLLAVGVGGGGGVPDGGQVSGQGVNGFGAHWDAVRASGAQAG